MKEVEMSQNVREDEFVNMVMHKLCMKCVNCGSKKSLNNVFESS